MSRIVVLLLMVLFAALPVIGAEDQPEPPPGLISEEDRKVAELLELLELMELLNNLENVEVLEENT
ncbi:MAG: hypothetical protein RQ754_03265 [Desulfuromonadales bacterium]|nr:hypothetical protein [Desulfuromonadales bacterium]